MGKHWSDDTALVESVARNLFEALPLLPKRLVRLDAITKEFGMPFSHIQILCMLSEGNQTIGEISSHLGIAKPNITPLLDSMRSRGLLERSRNEQDRRIVNVHLLPEGKELADRVLASISNQVVEWPASFSHSDMKRLNNALALLNKVAQHFSDEEIK